MEPYTILLAVVLIILAYYYLFVQNSDVFKKANIPYKPSFPLLGNMWAVFLRQLSFAEWIKDLYDINPEAKYVGVNDIRTPVVMIRDPELIKSIAVKHFEQFTDHRGFVDDVSDPLFGRNLFALRGERWREIRATLSPTFTSSKMRGMFRLMSECAKQFADYLYSLPQSEDGIDIKDAFTRYTNDVIATCAFGIKVNSMSDRDNKFYVLGKEVTTFGTVASIKFLLVRSLPRLTRLLGVKLVREEIARFFMDIVSDTIKTRDEKNISRPDMIQLMMESRGKMGSGKEMTIEDMTANVFIFFFGGFESTSTTMCFAAHELAVNSDVQERLQKEIDQVLEDCNGGEVTYEQINEMKYLDAVINETLRMYPVGILADRVCKKDFELPPTLPGAEPYTVKPGNVVWIPIYGLHYDPKYFEDPCKFNPGRFYDESKKYANSCVFLPFGIGPRMCIGNRFALLEIKALLFHVLATFNLKPSKKTSIPMKLSKKGLSMRPENGFWLKIEKRKDAYVSIRRNETNGITKH